MDEVDNTVENNIGLKKRGVLTNNGAEVGLVLNTQGNLVIGDR